MDWDVLKSNWALIVAAIIGSIIIVIIVLQLIKRSAGGQLRQTLKTLAKARLDEAKARKSVEKAERITRRLHENADRAKPRHLQEAKEALEDARALAKIANDKILIAENHVRRVILEEFPPIKHEAMREKYLPNAARDQKPFTFE
jgi:FtsZ-interacting cell division protein ZipA